QFFAFFLCCSRIRHTRFSLDWSADVCSSDLFVEAGRALGMSPMRILFRHVLINSWAPALVIATLGMGTAIVAEASLSFLGLGTQDRKSVVKGASAETVRSVCSTRRNGYGIEK